MDGWIGGIGSKRGSPGGRVGSKVGILAYILYLLGFKGFNYRTIIFHKGEAYKVSQLIRGSSWMCEWVG